MKYLPSLRLLTASAALATAALLSACGGGDPARSAAQEFASHITAQPASSQRVRSLAVPAASAPSRPITNAELFAWAQTEYPALFPGVPQTLTVPHEGKTFDVRAYANGNFLGVANGVAYGLGPFTGNELVSFGEVQGFACTVLPALCVPQGGSSINACLDPATASLPTGFRLNLVYLYSGLIGGEQTVSSVIDGPATFEGQSAIQITTTTSGSNTVQGITATTTSVIKTYEQTTANGLVRSLGATTDTTVTIPGISIPGLPPVGGSETVTRTRTVFHPPIENIEYTLSIGQSLDKVVSQTTTTLQSPFGQLPAPVTGTSTTRYTFEARENITVAAIGKTYDACRYRMADAGGDVTTSWFIAGKGVMVKSQATGSSGTQTIELKSGTYNGAPL